MNPFPQTKREFFFLWFGMVLNLIGVTIFVLSRKEHRKRFGIDPKKAIEVYRLPGKPIFPPKFHNRNNRPKNGIRIYPPLHAGGKPIDDRYKWAYEELIVKRKLNKPQAWEEFKKKYPNPVYESNPLIEQNDKENFYKAIDRRKRKAKKKDITT